MFSSNILFTFKGLSLMIFIRIVEYATRDQAQTAVNTLSNQNLMGRLVYVREVNSDGFPLIIKTTHSGTLGTGS